MDFTRSRPIRGGESILDRFIEFWEGLQDPRTGNAALHDFHEILAIAMRGSLRRAGLGGHGLVREVEGTVLRGTSNSRMACPVTTRSAGFSACSIPKDSGRRFSGSWRAFPDNAKGLWRSTARFCAARSTAPATSRRCRWSPPGAASSVVLAQIATDAKSNEITAVPKLLEMLTLKGTIVTADALNCQRAIARQIVDQGGDYALALKGNQGTLHNDVVLFLDDPESETISARPVVDAGHGRVETRAATVSTEIEWLVKEHQWPGLAAIGKVERTQKPTDLLGGRVPRRALPDSAAPLLRTRHARPASLPRGDRHHGGAGHRRERRIAGEAAAGSHGHRRRL